MKQMKSISILKLKLVDPPLEELERIAALVRLGRNAGVEDWLLRQRGKSETAKQSKESPRKPGQSLGESTKIYHGISAVVPELGSDVVASIAKGIWSNLGAKLDWRRRDGKPKKRMDAIVAYEDRPPWFTGTEIPVANKYAKVELGDELHLTVNNLVKPYEPLRLQLSLKGVPPSIKKRIRRVLSGELKFSDSRLLKKGEKWIWFWPISEEKPGVFSDRELILTPQFNEAKTRQSDKPFFTTSPDGRIWWLGDGRMIVAVTLRLIGLRKAIGYLKKNGLMASGHGRGKVDIAIRKRRTQERHMRHEFRHKLINDIIKQCIRHQCGTIIYREPTGPAKDKCWFERIELDFDWTSFLGDLKNSAARRGIAVTVKKLKIAEVLEVLEEVAA